MDTIVRMRVIGYPKLAHEMKLTNPVRPNEASSGHLPSASAPTLRYDVRNAASAPTQAEARRWNLDIPVRRAHENCAQEGGRTQCL
jgi:hypothetical protein